MGINYGDVATSEGFDAGYFEPGVYKVEVLRCLEKNTRKGDDVAIIEAKVLESSNPSIPVGAKRSQVISFRFESAGANLKSFAKAAVVSMHNQGLLEGPAPDGDVDGSTIQDIMQNGTAVGVVLELDCVGIETKAGNPFTKHNWAPAA